MNTQPNRLIDFISRSVNRCWVACVVSVLVVVGVMLETGCADSDAAKALDKPVPASNLTATTTTNFAVRKEASDAATSLQQEPVEVQEETTEAAEAPSSGVLGTASKLLEKAKSTSGSTAAGAGRWVKDKIGGAAQAGSQTADDTWKWANETFESLKAQGLTSAGDTSEWLGEDWHNMDSWEYKVVTFSGHNDDELTEKLNELGKQGWDCFNTENKTEGIRFYFKKPIFSYLRHLPFKDAIKLVPMISNGDK